MKEFKCKIMDELGIHARPAGLFAKACKELGETVVTITKDDKTVKASQLMKLMGLGVKNGDEITVAVDGGDEDAALEIVKNFLIEHLAAQL